MKRPSMTLYHANARGTGTALRLELYPASPDAYGSILVTLASQKTFVENESGRPIPIFDWENNALKFRLGILELAKVLQVFRGQYESIDEGKGLYCRTNKVRTIVRLTHCIEPVVGYVLDVSHNPNDSGEVVSMQFALNECEAFALSEAISQAMLYVAFGVPSNK